MPKFGSGAGAAARGEVGETLPGCAAVARMLSGRAGGTAAYMSSWVLIEQPGPWSADALEDTLAQAFPSDRLERARAAGLRPLLVRRPGKHQRNEGAPRTVFVGSGAPGNRWLERLEITDLAELADLDLEAVAEGRPGHGEPVSGPLFLVCTHGTKDMCCALLGRPVAKALAENHAARSWEVSHVGGDRWAGNLLVVPDGYLHGQLDPTDATMVAKAALAGQVHHEHLRGRTSARTPWEQYAEIAVRRHTGLRGVDAVVSVGELADPEPTAHPEESRVVRVRAGDDRYEVTVRRSAARDSGASRCSGRITLSGYEVDEIHILARG